MQCCETLKLLVQLSLSLLAFQTQFFYFLISRLTFLGGFFQHFFSDFVSLFQSRDLFTL
ncbi:hypothetical protein THIOM_004217 [Candidatus Thiomargarita nelsonii]|uniref:Uncharacterized protein n=1 Tax=Candidatus Thiomargarita nelsonii TaxID=1003181 RepID=A0A176RWE4_9GAMM|nr:hypothetical protein THIOM_004217 [Candidatus Thiomargarita nelsonii]